MSGPDGLEHVSSPPQLPAHHNGSSSGRGHVTASRISNANRLNDDDPGRRGGVLLETLSGRGTREVLRGHSSGGSGTGLVGIRELSASRNVAAAAALLQDHWDHKATDGNLGMVGSLVQFPRGQKLLEELEAEMRLLDECEAGGVAGQVSEWCSEFESVLARMDRLADSG